MTTVSISCLHLTLSFWSRLNVVHYWHICWQCALGVFIKQRLWLTW